MYLRYRESVWEKSDAAAGVARSSVVESVDGADLLPTTAGRKPIPSVEVQGLKIHAITERDCISHILDELDAGRGGVVVTPNLDHLRRYLSDVNFRVLVAEADLVVADGMPLVWASKIQSTPVPERVAGSNLISTLSASASGRGRSIFLLGGAGETARKAASELQARHPNLRIGGWLSPRPGFEKDPAEMSAIIAALSAAKPNIIYVALGSPKQEQLIAQLKPILPGSWWLGVGNSFSFLCGDVKRAPKWMQEIGLEWVHRLAQEPRRLFYRYVTAGVPFAVSLLAKSSTLGVMNRVRWRVQAARRLLTGRSGDTAFSATPQPRTIAPSASPKAAPQLSRVDWPTTGADFDRGNDATPLSRLRSLILLGGAVRANVMSSATGRSVLDLPLNENGSILNFWLTQAADTAKMAGLERLPVRITVDRQSPEPQALAGRYAGMYCVERDLSEYRGTGGVLRDIAQHYDDDDLIIVANAAQILLDPLPLVINALLRKRGDVAVVSHDDGTPSGIMLLACKTLRMLPSHGFTDMKEQGLPLIASKFDVRVVRRRRPTGLPIRSLEGYIQGLHFYHRRNMAKGILSDPLTEDWTPSFSLIEPGATVDSSARVHDSVVLSGGFVEPGAVLVRSVVCPGAVVRRDRTAVDQLVTIERKSRMPVAAAG